MKKIYNYIFILIVLSVFKPLIINADNTVCTYDKDLTITFDSAGQPSINQNFYELKNEDLLFYREYAGNVETPSHEDLIQLNGLQGSCPSKVYYCKLAKAELDTPVDILKNLEEINKAAQKDDAEAKDILLSLTRLFIPSAKIEKKVLIYTSKADATGEYLGINLSNDDNVEKGVGYDYLDELKEASRDPSLSKLLEIMARYLTVGVSGVDRFYYREKECAYTNYTGDLPTYNLACSYTRVFLNEYDKIVEEYKSCGNNQGCKSQKITKLNNQEKKLKLYCNNILENYDYNEDIEQDCIEACFTISDTIVAAKKAAGLLKNGTGECGFSERLADWGLNIMKWIKYIVPVFVIIFGIIDFIKAMSGDKEDEMKKSQKKFITRLIAAALIFIIPFIIEFVLDKFGFTEYIDGCGVITEME